MHWGRIQEFHKEKLVTTTTPEDDDNRLLHLSQGEDSHLEKVGGVVGDSGLPGQQPDGQVDEAQLPVVVCRGLLVEGGGAYYHCQTG